MKILFWGETGGSTGPDNVNKLLLNHLTDAFVRIKSKNRLFWLLEASVLSRRCDVVVISGVSRRGCVLAALAKRTVYLMHGCAAREGEADNLTNIAPALRQERYLMEKADLLLPVSRGFRDWVRQTYPQYARKTEFLHPGFLPCQVTVPKIPGSIVAAGGDSAIKNNAPLLRAAEGLGWAKLAVYGTLRHSTPSTTGNSRCCGFASHDVFLAALARAEIFVLNSRFETFSLTVLEALSCGCSVLVSEAAGVTEVLALEEGDRIRDPMDENEIRQKLSALRKRPNNRRLLAALEWEALSPGRCAVQLEKICARFVEKENGL